MALSKDNIIAIVQARTVSTRLPGKVLCQVIGIPMILLQLERMQKSEYAKDAVVATTVDKSDDGLVKVLENAGHRVFRGSNRDVLDRYYRAACGYDAKHVIRITADCPLMDSEVIDDVVREHIVSKADYTSNTVPPTYPDGLDVEVVTMTALHAAWKYARLRSEREHVTLFIKNNANEFRCINVKARKDMSHLRWTVDEKEDLEFVREVYAALRLTDQEITLNSVLRLIEQQPHLGQINKGIGRDEGLGKSLKEDGLFQRS